MSFDGTVHLGDVITMLTVVVGLGWKILRDKENFARLETKVDLVYDWFRDNVLKQTSKGD